MTSGTVQSATFPLRTTFKKHLLHMNIFPVKSTCGESVAGDFCSHNHLQSTCHRRWCYYIYLNNGCAVFTRSLACILMFESTVWSMSNRGPTRENTLSCTRERTNSQAKCLFTRKREIKFSRENKILPGKFAFTWRQEICVCVRLKVLACTNWPATRVRSSNTTITSIAIGVVRLLKRLICIRATYYTLADTQGRR